MTSAFDGLVVAIHAKKFAGTGFFVSPGVVLTCAHLFPDFELSGTRRRPKQAKILCGEAILPVSDTRTSADLDLCCLYVEASPGAKVVRLARTTSLRGERLTIAGYCRDHTGPRRHVIPELEVIHDLQEEKSGKLQYGQLQGGAPEGFSGAPVLARSKNAWVALGMLQLGEQHSATSRFIAADSIAPFLAEHGVEITLDEFQSEQRPETREQAQTGGMHTIFNFNGNMSDSTIIGQINNQDPEPKKR